MDKSEAIELAKTYKQLVSRHFDVKDTILFGSYSKGTQTEESDIDIAVIVDEIKGNYFDYAPLLWKLKRQVSNLIEPVLICRKDDKLNFLAEIKQSGISV